MRKVALIPARYAASRFPGKMMADLGGKTVIWRTYESTLATGLFDEVAVVCDHPIIYDEINANGGKVILSKRTHECGTDRIAEAAEEMDADIIVNVQGDEPFTRREPLEKLLRAFEGEEGKSVRVASLMQVLTDAASINHPNFVKVAVDLHFNALFFSRSPIPYHRSKDLQPVYYEHIGVYAFRKQTLMEFTRLPLSPLESIEKIECLRYLENGIPLKMVVTDYMGVEIDTPEDLVKATGLL